MSRDVAQRDLDQSGFRISNLGAPQAAGDATATDNKSLPLPDSASGSPGASLLAAPADHVHPAAPGSQAMVQIESEGEQETTGPNEVIITERFVDLSVLLSGQVTATFSAEVEVDSGTATFNVRLGGTSGNADGGILATMTSQSPTFETRIVVGPKQSGLSQPALVKITAATDNPNTTCRIKNRRVVLVG